MISPVEAARGWVGTPFEHAGRVKGEQGGTDCVGLVLGVAKEVGLVEESFQTPFYEQLNDGSMLTDIFPDYAEPVELGEAEPGDVVIMQYGRFPQHIGIVADCPVGMFGLSIIDAYSPLGRVAERPLDDVLIGRIVQVWRVAWVK